MARHEQEDLLPPLTNRKEHDQYETSLYMKPFVKEPAYLALMPPSNISSSMDYEDNSNESIEGDLDTLVKNM